MMCSIGIEKTSEAVIWVQEDRFCNLLAMPANGTDRAIVAHLLSGFHVPDQEEL